MPSGPPFAWAPDGHQLRRSRGRTSADRATAEHWLRTHFLVRTCHAWGLGGRVDLPRCAANCAREATLLLRAEQKPCSVLVGLETPDTDMHEPFEVDGKCFVKIEVARFAPTGDEIPNYASLDEDDRQHLRRASGLNDEEALARLFDATFEAIAIFFGLRVGRIDRLVERQGLSKNFAALRKHMQAFVTGFQSMPREQQRLFELYMSPPLVHRGRLVEEDADGKEVSEAASKLANLLSYFDVAEKGKRGRRRTHTFIFKDFGERIVEAWRSGGGQLSWSDKTPGLRFFLEEILQTHRIEVDIGDWSEVEGENGSFATAGKPYRLSDDHASLYTAVRTAVRAAAKAGTTRENNGAA